MIRIFWAFLLAASALFCNSSCKNGKTEPVIITRDTTITPETAITAMVLDSAGVEKYIQSSKLNESAAQRLRNFYVARNYQYTWFDESGITQQARGFWNLYNYYLTYNPDSTLLDKELQTEMSHFLDDSLYYKSTGKLPDTELRLTRYFFEYAQYAYAGKIDPSELQWHIPRKKLDVVALLDSLLKTGGADIQAWEPVNENYLRMQEKLRQYSDIRDAGGWDTLAVNKKISPGDDAAFIREVKNRLYREGLLTAEDSSTVYDSIMKKAVAKARSRYGLNEKGGWDKSLVSELNVSVEKRIRQILVNMERMRWLPKPASDILIVANIPDFKLRVYEGKNVALDMNIVVGKQGTNSVIFTNMLKYIVFSPYWNVPYSISKNEILPAMNRNRNYLARNNMEITGYNGKVPVVRQKPGGNNSLGRVKFLFPNSYNIYFHDTPSKSLFEREQRAFSHGCIRLQKPFELAQYLLRHQPQWTEDSIRVAMDQDNETWVTLPSAVPVFITYLTSYVDNNGDIHFTRDIYGHDKKLEEKLFHASVASKD
ncbi:MAG: hypothetical protein EOO01_06515 [Chitinophagaceae bacterium]|nr:MAG: hypothetical protein EOO01_06515 [Chitinophagaceae bacterium]